MNASHSRDHSECPITALAHCCLWQYIAPNVQIQKKKSKKKRKGKAFPKLKAGQQACLEAAWLRGCNFFEQWLEAAQKSGLGGLPFDTFALIACTSNGPLPELLLGTE